VQEVLSEHRVDRNIGLTFGEVIRCFFQFVIIFVSQRLLRN
jgi:hypothetical protein